MTILGVVVLAGNVLSAKNPNEERIRVEKFAKEIREPSGISYHPQKKCLIVVGDEGQIAEVSLSGDVISLRNLGGDLEGVTVDVDHSVVYVIEEKLEAIKVVDMKTFGTIDTLPLGQIVEQSGFFRSPKDSFEGIAYESIEGSDGGILWLGYQKNPAALFPLKLEGNPIRVKAQAPIKVDLPEISGLCIDPRNGNLWIVCDSEDACFQVSKDGEILSKKKIGGDNQEGVIVLPNGDWWFADDAGGIFKMVFSGD